jgi:acyl carrier protein
MTRQDILKTVAETLADVLELDDVALTETTTANDVEGWDSINHVRLLIGLERHYGFEFASDEASGLKNVGVLIDLIQTKVS